MEDNRVPIYTADVTIEVLSRKTHKVLERIEKENEVCKGFTIPEIKKALQTKLEGVILKNKTSIKEKYIRIQKVHLRRQHGYGINEKVKSRG